ncbi:MAG: hypothetical protein WCE21_03645 [Candidatus Babeliales bacterium]
MRKLLVACFYFLYVTMGIHAQNYEAEMLITISPIAPQFEYTPEEKEKNKSLFKIHEYIQLVPLTPAGKDKSKKITLDIPSNDMAFTEQSTRYHVKTWLIHRYQALTQWSKEKGYTITSLTIEVKGDAFKILPGRRFGDSFKESRELIKLNEQQLNDTFFAIASDIFDFIKEFGAFIQQATQPVKDGNYEAHFFIEIPQPADQITMQIAINPSMLSAYEQTNLEQISRYGETLNEVIIPRDQLQPLVVTNATAREVEKWLMQCAAQFQKWRANNPLKHIIALYFEGKYHGSYLKTAGYYSHTPAPRTYIAIPSFASGMHIAPSFVMPDITAQLHAYAQNLLIYIKKLQTGMYSGPSPFGEEPEEPSLSSNTVTQALIELQGSLQALAQKLSA